MVTCWPVFPSFYITCETHCFTVNMKCRSVLEVEPTILLLFSGPIIDYLFLPMQPLFCLALYCAATCSTDFLLIALISHNATSSAHQCSSAVRCSTWFPRSLRPLEATDSEALLPQTLSLGAALHDPISNFPFIFDPSSS